MDETISASRAFLITSNNPQKHYGWAELDYATATEEDYQRVLIEAIALHVEGKNGVCRSSEKNGALAVFEEGGCPHFHMLVVAANPIKFKALQTKFNHSEIEPLRGTIDEAIAYLYKEGKHADKQDTQKCLPVGWGEYFSNNEEPLDDKPVFVEIDELMEQGLRPREIYKLGSKFAFYRNAIETAYSARMALAIPEKRTVAVYYHVGRSNTGKSHEYWRLCDEHTSEQVYFVNGEYRNIWDVYSFEPVVFLDDFRGSHMPLTSLLGLLDEYPTVARCRYADKRLAFTEIHLTSVIPPEELYPYAGREEFEQLKRRITYVVYHYRNDACEGEGRFRKITVLSEEYEGCRQLEELATGEVLGSLAPPLF